MRALPQIQFCRLLLIFFGMTLFNAAAQKSLAAEPAPPPSVWSGKTTQTSNGLPDGEYALSPEVSGARIAAWYGTPTRRYRHAILGDDIEAGSLHVAVKNGASYKIDLPEDQVFEDRTPRIVDLDGDGQFEIVTIRSFKRSGGSIALFGIRGGKLVELASTKPIGRSNRWLNVAGIADYAGLGSSQIAYVETPHIGGTLYIVKWQGKELKPIASLYGFSNHAIGSREQDLSADIHAAGRTQPDLLVPANSRRQMKLVGMRNGKLEALAEFDLSSEILKRTAVKAANASDCAAFLLKDGSETTLCHPVR